MSRIVHRQPVWTWSLLLLSTLLLTPSTAAVVLAALRQARVATIPAATVSAPRRATTEEEEAIKAAAQSGRLKLVRLEPGAEHNALAILTPTLVTVSLPELRVEPQTWPFLGTHFLTPALPSGGSRAPPLG